MKKINISKKLQELEKEEMALINGGDNFLHDLGYIIGRACRWVKDNYAEIIRETGRPTWSIR